MTEESFQQGRKVMQKANYWRGIITKGEGNVAKWTKIESTFRTNLQPSRADGAKKMLDRALKDLKKYRNTFTDIKFPENNITNPVKHTVQCENCGDAVERPDDTVYCNKCLGI